MRINVRYKNLKPQTIHQLWGSTQDKSKDSAPCHCSFQVFICDLTSSQVDRLADESTCIWLGSLFTVDIYRGFK